MKILYYDIETSPLVTFAWEIWQADAIKVIHDSQILCFAYKWQGERTVKVIGQDDFKDYKPGVNNDTSVVKALWELFNEADVVIAHNGNQFDQKVSQARMMVRGLTPPTPYKQIDTKLVAKRYARFASNKLDSLGKYLELGQKLSTGGFKIWEGCLSGDPKSWDKMKRYNCQDVRLLEQIYLKLRPWMDNHPAMGLMGEDTSACPKCGGGPLIKLGNYYTKVSRFQVWKCKNCGGHPRSRLPDKIDKVMYV